MTFVSIVTVGMTLFFLGVALIAFMNLHRWLGEASEQAGVILYLRDSVASDSAARGRLETRIASFPQTSSVTFVGKDEARRRFERMYGLEMLDAAEENPLPASFELTLDDRHRTPEALGALKRELGELAGVEDVRYAEEWQVFLERARVYFAVAAALLAPVFVLALHFMIANTIKLTIYARRELVTNMHFVGATDLYIKTPFILEGMVQGMVGGGIAVMALATLRALTGRVSLYWGPWYFFLLVFMVGVLFGWMGSRSAVRKFLA
jgi:cell division transport system permease protein